MKLLKVQSIDKSRQSLLDSAYDMGIDIDNIPLIQAHGRILAEDIKSPDNLPSFRRSTVDGYAVVSKSTGAAGESMPVFLNNLPAVEMGQPAKHSITPGDCAYVPTGGMLPDGADAVVMVEYSEIISGDSIALYSGVSTGENVVQIAEDTARGDIVLTRGTKLRFQEIGALAAMGVTSVPVYSNLRLTIISTGDELVSPDVTPTLGQIRDINTYALYALAEKRGYEVVKTAVLQDDKELLEKTIRDAMETSDVVAVSGGSSKGRDDATQMILDKVSSPGVFTHGVSIKPGKPTILGYDERSKTLLTGLPGHPVSAMIVFDVYFGWLTEQLTGTTEVFPIPARSSVNIPGGNGRTCYQPVRLEIHGESYSAHPVYGKSGLITSLTQADGYIIINRDDEGHEQGDLVMVYPF